MFGVVIETCHLSSTTTISPNDNDKVCLVSPLILHLDV